MGVMARNPRSGVLALVLCGLAALVSAPRAHAEDQPAVLVVKLPADAQLEIGGYKSKKTGEVRKFETPVVTRRLCVSARSRAYQMKSWSSFLIRRGRGNTPR